MIAAAWRTAIAVRGFGAIAVPGLRAIVVAAAFGLSAQAAHAACGPETAAFDPSAGAAWAGWGAGLANTRNAGGANTRNAGDANTRNAGDANTRNAGDANTRNAGGANTPNAGLANARNAGASAEALSAGDLPSLSLGWAFGFPGARSVMGQPAVAGNRVFIGVDTGEVYSIDVESGCADWRFEADAGVRTAPVVAEIGGRRHVFFGDLGARVYALDAATGALEWQVKVDAHPAARITGTPQWLPAARGRATLFVPVSSGEEGLGGDPRYLCCLFRGSVVALDAATGERLWKTHTIEQAPAWTGPGRFGPSGAAVWSAPTLDPARGLLYATTGDAYSAPADEATDAVLALDLGSGRVRWKRQATAGDVWVVSCLGEAASEACGPDQDFGSPAMRVSSGGRDLLVAGQKSGNVWAFEPTTGEVLWRTPLVEDTTQFGGKIVWGGAADAANAYFGLGTGLVAAVRLTDGAPQWFREIEPAAGRADHPGLDGPLTVSGDLLFSGGWDGVLRALSVADGRVLWQYDTVRAFETANGVAAHGGSMGAAGPVVAGQRLFVPSGYIGVKNGMPGNVLLMFAAK